jgi:hypothetical protein
MTADGDICVNDDVQLWTQERTISSLLERFVQDWECSSVAGFLKGLWEKTSGINLRCSDIIGRGHAA